MEMMLTLKCPIKREEAKDIIYLHLEERVNSDIKNIDKLITI